MKRRRAWQLKNFACLNAIFRDFTGHFLNVGPKEDPFSFCLKKRKLAMSITKTTICWKEWYSERLCIIFAFLKPNWLTLAKQAIAGGDGRSGLQGRKTAK